jgi:DNA-binding XRE family transcriptional regulator
MTWLGVCGYELGVAEKDTGRLRERMTVNCLEDAVQQYVTERREHLRLCQAIKRYRLAREMTQVELGVAIGRRGAYISEIETGKRGVKLEVLVLISRALQIPVKQFLPDWSETP